MAASVAEGIGDDGLGGGALEQAATARAKKDPKARLACFMLVLLKQSDLAPTLDNFSSC
jgi:hypothetical protein